MHYCLIVICFLSAMFFDGDVHAQDRPAKMPHEDVVLVPAIGEGLCLSNLFQTNMVLQRDKPVAIWGWAKPGENVTVTFGVKTQASTVAADRSWKVELPALPASAEPRKMVVQGKDSKIELENILVGDIWVLGGQSNMEFEICKVEGGRACPTFR